jgi:hypothetical protein
MWNAVQVSAKERATLLNVDFQELANGAEMPSL